MKPTVTSNAGATLSQQRTLRVGRPADRVFCRTRMGCTIRVRGFTAIELLVAIGVTLVLIALLAPAVQQASESARAAGCRNNLKQLAIAVHAYEAVHKTVPGWLHYGILKRYPGTGIADIVNNHASVQVQLLPYLGYSEIYDALNQTHIAVPSDPDTLNEAWNLLSTISSTRIATFLCPSDALLQRPGNNYRGCIGNGPLNKFNAYYPDGGTGFFSPLNEMSVYPTPFSIFLDGLGKTAMFSERLVGSGDPNHFDPRRDATILRKTPKNADQTMVACQRMQEVQPKGGHYPYAGKAWLSTGIHQTLYTHALPPNSAIADCLLFAPPPYGAAAARSAHPGICNVAMGDGAVRVVHDSVDLYVWRALATRNGGETFPEGGY